MYINTVSYTPIQKINEKINDNTYYIKRDDLIPLSFGGNKARKAILFFEDLKKNDFNCVVTVSYTHLDVYKRQPLYYLPP